jgi:hypothetical protein
MRTHRLAVISAIALFLVLFSSGAVFAYSNIMVQASTPQPTSQNPSHELVYRMAGTNGQSGQGQGNIQIQGTGLKVDVEIEHADATTAYSVALVAIPTGSGGTSFGSSGVSTSTTAQNVCTNSIGQLMTSKVGQGIAHLDTTLPVGTYQIGIVLCIGNSPAIISQPTTQEGITTQGTGSDESSTLSSEAQSVAPVTPGQQGQGQIQSAEHDGTIVAVVGNGNEHSHKLSNVNSDLSAAVGTLGTSGLIVSLSSASATGPGALLVNLGNVPIANVLKGLAVTFDGAIATPVSSISQVLNSQAGQANYVLLQTSSGLELLMSIPHLSNNIIQIFPVFVYNWVLISTLAFASVTAVGAIALMYRKNYLAIPQFR